jgi:hypothetical protein
MAVAQPVLARHTGQAGQAGRQAHRNAHYAQRMR